MATPKIFNVFRFLFLFFLLLPYLFFPSFVQAVGEPPFFLASSAFFAIKDAISSARKDHGESGYFQLMSPASSERSVEPSFLKK